MANALDSLVQNIINKDSNYIAISANMRRHVTNGGSTEDSSYQHWQQEAQEILSMAEKILRENLSKEFESLKSLAEKIKFERYGFKFDVAMGFVNDFPLQQFDKGYLSKGGGWITLGWDWRSGYSLLGIARFLHSPDEIFADEEGILKSEDIQTFDAGLRLISTNESSKFLISLESLYRSVLNNSQIDPSWRATLTLEYDVAKNTKLTFSFGRDFDGTISKDGNVIAALNFLKGFGTQKILK
jgi:hypothetical protein